MKVMVVEDEPINLKLACVVLKSEGHKVLQAKTAGAALKMVKKHKPDVLLLDLLLPDIDGLTLVRQMKEDPETTAIPVVAVTAHPERWSERDARAAGCDAYLVKPIDTRMLPKQLAEATRSKPR
ncbi:MAG TPA: response regulator [Blastocatellia bacterium]|jgi:CheY-like chemotaxis protein|nr:response regulator [Blastocatellia bacterium]